MEKYICTLSPEIKRCEYNSSGICLASAGCGFRELEGVKKESVKKKWYEAYIKK